MGKYNLKMVDNQYYSTGEAGYYQFTSLDNIIDHFMIAYVGEDKIIPKVKKLDVAYHAQRAMQELSFDTFKSLKAQEITVPNSLKTPLPQDYVNYTKIVRSDASGIEHIIYPTSKTSNPQSKGNLIDFNTSNFKVDAGETTLGTGFSWTNENNTGGAIIGGSSTEDGATQTTVAIGTKITFSVPFKSGKRYMISFRTQSLGYTVDQTPQGKFKVYAYSEAGMKSTIGRNMTVDYLAFDVGSGDRNGIFSFFPQNSNFEDTSDTDSEKLVFEVVEEEWMGILDNVSIVEHPYTDADQNNLLKYGGSNNSTVWDSYKSITPSENNNDDYEDDTYWPLQGDRYGLDPQYAQANGSFFIDQLTGFIHFSSNLNGQNIIIKYISDSLGTTEELQVHKFAEEAMYKWIAYAILSTRTNVPEYLVQRYKKEKFAETRKAKLRLSNIKLEELTQILRGKSKQIKH